MTEHTGETRRPVRVAIAGGGCAGLAAAWHLSQQPGYEVHVYERSWRLGGKGASVRDKDGRIRDHGLHIWLGFYENAFRMARECYAEVHRRGWGPHAGPPHRLTHGRFEEAFFPEPHIGVAGRGSAGDWVVWSGHLPPAPGIPGDPLRPGSNPFTVTTYLLRCIDLLKTLMLSVIGLPDGTRPGASGPDPLFAIDADFPAAGSPELIIDRITRGVRNATLTTAGALLQTVAFLEKRLGGSRADIAREGVETELPRAPGAEEDERGERAPQSAIDQALIVLRALAAQVVKELRYVVEIDPELRWKTEIIDVVLTIAVGLYRDRVLFEREGLDATNGQDYRAWLRRHGATKTCLESRFLTGIYDFLFAYEQGRRESASLAAGVALRGALRMFFTYRGAMFWRMRSGMGDAVFAPLYKVMLLEDRKPKGDSSVALPPVAFHFLHELSGVTLASQGKGRRFVTELHFRTCGDPDTLDRYGAHALDDAGCWPDSPSRFGQTTQSGWTGARTLRIAQDFDAVVFALSIDDLKRLGSGPSPNQAGGFLAEMPPEWREMAGAVQTVATKAAQVWLDKDLDELGWHRGSVLVSALGRRFDTWADMTHTLGSERAWRMTQIGKPSRDDAVRSVAYFCAALCDDIAQQGHDHATGTVRDDLQQTLADGMRYLWPAAFAGRHTAEDSVVGDRHVQANIEGSDRYVLSLPSSIGRRISPLDCSVLNMTIAGDWTACGLDVGCIEAAVMSGMLAAHAITGGEPPLESIVGYDHP